MIIGMYAAACQQNVLAKVAYTRQRFLDAVKRPQGKFTRSFIRDSCIGLQIIQYDSRLQLSIEPSMKAKYTDSCIINLYVVRAAISLVISAAMLRAPTVAIVPQLRKKLSQLTTLKS